MLISYIYFYEDKSNNSSVETVRQRNCHCVHERNRTGIDESEINMILAASKPYELPKLETSRDL